MSAITDALREAAAFIDEHNLPFTHVSVYDFGTYVSLADEGDDESRRNAIRRWATALGADIEERVARDTHRVHVHAKGNGIDAYAILDETREPVTA